MQLTIPFQIKMVIKSTELNGINIRNQVGQNEQIRCHKSHIVAQRNEFQLRLRRFLFFQRLPLLQHKMNACAMYTSASCYLHFLVLWEMKQPIQCLLLFIRYIECSIERSKNACTANYSGILLT